MTTRVFAVAAHADDIEFGMAGTLIRLAEAGCELHCMTVANGSCGTATLDAEQIVAIRAEEARQAAAALGATCHPSLVPDIEIYYTRQLLARMGAVMRDVAPDILLVQSPQDYMEDHMNSSRLAVSAAFCRGMRNFPTDPPRPQVANEVAVYYAQPHGNRDPLNRVVKPDFYIDITGVIDRKEQALACHRSQKEWLDVSQGFDSYLQIMRDLGREVGRWTGVYTYAEGWRYRNPLGLCAAEADPLARLLAGCRYQPASV
jgi:LmbE family N-acetylglucosaminyl deacetylase